MKLLSRLFFYLFLINMVFLTSCKKEIYFKTYTKPEITVGVADGRLANDTIHFFKDTVYILATNIIRNTGQKLIVDAGTLIKVNDGLSIIINKGARIEAKGTSSEPIVFTSSAFQGIPGYVGLQNEMEHSWFGIAIYGNYPEPIDNSIKGTGIFSYARIEFAGSSKNNINGLPPLLLQNIGKGTIIENIQVSHSVAANSFEISGGNFNARNLISYASARIDFLLKDSYTGMLQNILAYRHPYFPNEGNIYSGVPISNRSLAGLLIEGEATFPTISNLTVIGPDLQFGTNLKYSDTLSSSGGSRVASFMMKGGRFHIRNTVLMGFPVGAIYIDGKSTAASLEEGSSDFKFALLHSNDSNRTFYLTPNIYKRYTTQDLKEFILRPAYGSQHIFSSSNFMFTDPFNFDINPNPLPKPGSPVLTGADFSEPAYQDAFFNKVTYRGAIGTENWLQGWTNFIPLQTNYNN